MYSVAGGLIFIHVTQCSGLCVGVLIGCMIFSASICSTTKGCIFLWSLVSVIVYISLLRSAAQSAPNKGNNRRGNRDASRSYIGYTVVGLLIFIGLVFDMLFMVGSSQCVHGLGSCSTQLMFSGVFIKVYLHVTTIAMLTVYLSVQYGVYGRVMISAYYNGWLGLAWICSPYMSGAMCVVLCLYSVISVCKLGSECSTWLMYIVCASNIGYLNILQVSTFCVTNTVVGIIFGVAILSIVVCAQRCWQHTWLTDMGWLGAVIQSSVLLILVGWLGLTWLLYGLLKAVLAIDAYYSASTCAIMYILMLWLIWLYRGVFIALYIRGIRMDVSAVGECTYVAISLSGCCLV